MSIKNDTGRAGGATDLENTSLKVDAYTANIKQKPEISQALIELLFEDIGDNTGAMISTLNAALAMRDAGDCVGMIYGLQAICVLDGREDLLSPAAPMVCLACSNKEYMAVDASPPPHHLRVVTGQQRIADRISEAKGW
jgi:hypothetical protein